MKKAALFILLSGLVFGFSGCKNSPFAVAYVKYDAGGCGYLLEIAGEDFHATSLDTAFQQDSIYIDITFEYKTTTFVCGTPGDTLREIEILESRLHDE